MFRVFLFFLLNFSLTFLTNSEPDCHIVSSLPDCKSKNTIRIMQYNVEWLFLDYYAPMDCPGNGCTWVNESQAASHLDYVAKVIDEISPDIVNLCEVEGCDELHALNNQLSNNSYQTYLLNEQNEIDYDSLIYFLRQYSSAPFFMFGFTSSVFESLINKLSIKKVNQNFKNAILLHGGGWKKMENKKINNFLFKQKIFKKLGIKKIFNYYGLIEQTGSIFLECEKCGCFSTSIFSDVIIRDKNFNVVTNGKRGMIQLLSLLPTSYPGHVILTEDIGEIVDNNGCDCSKTGKSFLVHGRAEKSEIRGCSDT